MVDPTEIVAYFSLAVLLYYFLLELSKPKSTTQNFITWIFIFLLLVAGGYYLWRANSSTKKAAAPQQKFTAPEEEETPEEIPEEVEVFIPKNYTPLKRDFALLNEKKGHDDLITYQDFKFWYLSPEFLQKFTTATQTSLRLKRARLALVKKRYLADLAVLQNGEKPRRGLAGMLRDLDRHDDSKILEDAVEKIDALIEEARALEEDVSIETTRKNLISALTDKEKGIDSLIGMVEVKDFLARKLYTFAENPRIFFSSFQNIRLYGSAGIGKTKAAEVIGHVYASSGILIRNHVHLATTSELTTAYVNESSKKTRKLLLSNLESVVFIDEAYGMTPSPNILGDNGHDHGHEAVTELVNFTDKMMGLSIIIVAGYKDAMEERFMKANEGLASRFPILIQLHPYSANELTQILIKALLKKYPGLSLNEEQANYLYTAMNYVNENFPEAFKYQGRDMVNLSGHLAEAICGTPGKNWKDSSEELILSGINSFLAIKGHSIEELE